MSIDIIPRPMAVTPKHGHFQLTEATRICTCYAARAEARFLAESLRPATGFELPVHACQTDCDNKGNICLDLISDRMPEEAYELDADTDGIKLKAATHAGLFYGVQTLRQLLPPDIFRQALVSGKTWTVPCVHIDDAPRFKWRGMHLDSARHFMPREFIKKFIDLLALHKMNSFHWHLTDDQGWRLEIKKYPKLLETGAWRDETLVGHQNNRPRIYDGRRHGGFYTQDDVREIVAYAAERHINVVPEIEMPGHSQAVLAAYPELGCPDGPFQTRKIWGISPDVFCAGNEQSFTFLQNVLTEVMGIFPSPYIHIGGDECLKQRWQKCPKCQARIKKEGLKDEHELQSYFIRRIETFLNDHGRKMIGWGEILEGGLAPNATIMPWRRIEDGIEAANAGHDVVFAAHDHTYFDLYQSVDQDSEPLAIGGYLALEKAYRYEPVPEELAPGKLQHVLGAQGQLWSEYMPDPKHVEYMAFPRLTALCEVVWSPKENKDYADYLHRLNEHLKRLDVLDVNCRKG